MPNHSDESIDETESRDLDSRDGVAAETVSRITAEVWEDVDSEANVDLDGDANLDGNVQLPFVSRWNSLISTTNWEKGRIIAQWREALIESGAPSSEYSDEAWATHVGGVTAPHVGRLRRVFIRFGDHHETYAGLYWSHFLAALDWDDAALWLQGAVEESWSVSIMRDNRWRAGGGDEADRPSDAQIISADLDEDSIDLGTAPAQGDGRTKDFDGDTDGVAAGPVYDSPDFGDEEEFNSLGGNGENPGGETATQSPPSPTQPFAGLPELPDDLSDVVEQLKLSILRHKSAGFRDVSADVIRRYLDAVALLIES